MNMLTKEQVAARKEKVKEHFNVHIMGYHEYDKNNNEIYFENRFGSIDEKFYVGYDKIFHYDYWVDFYIKFMNIIVK